jgi:enoyl-CoA hydratase
MSEPVILVEKHGEAALVTLNRAQSMNALSRELRGLIAETFDKLEADRGTRVVVLTGAGKAFCAGLDLKELGSGSSSVQGSVDARDPVTSMGRFSGPIIGAINGVAITGGFEVALACDVLICSTEARFADTHGRVGIMPGWGLSQRLSRTIGIYRAKELSLTGNFMSAAQAVEWGMVNRVVPPAELIPQSLKLAQDMLSLVPGCLSAYKKIIDVGYAQPFGEGMATERRLSSAANRAVSATDIEARRETVRARGQTQKR